MDAPRFQSSTGLREKTVWGVGNTATITLTWVLIDWRTINKYIFQYYQASSESNIQFQKFKKYSILHGWIKFVLKLTAMTHHKLIDNATSSMLLHHIRFVTFDFHFFAQNFTIIKSSAEEIGQSPKNWYGREDKGWRKKYDFKNAKSLSTIYWQFEL